MTRNNSQVRITRGLNGIFQNVYLQIPMLIKWHTTSIRAQTTPYDVTKLATRPCPLESTGKGVFEKRSVLRDTKNKISNIHHSLYECLDNSPYDRLNPLMWNETLTARVNDLITVTENWSYAGVK